MPALNGKVSRFSGGHIASFMAGFVDIKRVIRVLHGIADFDLWIGPGSFHTTRDSQDEDTDANPCMPDRDRLQWLPRSKGTAPPSRGPCDPPDSRVRLFRKETCGEMGVIEDHEPPAPWCGRLRLGAVRWRQA